MSLPTDAKERKDIPVYSGFVCYFPDAIAEVAKLSKAGNDQHNPGKPLHWDRSKSGDERDALMRHVIDGACIMVGDEDALDLAILEARAVAWRSMADLQKLCEQRDEENRALNDLLHRASPWDKEVVAREYQNPDFKNSKSQKFAEPRWHDLNPIEQREYIERLNRGHDL